MLWPVLVCVQACHADAYVFPPQAAAPLADGHDHSAAQFEATLDAVEQLKAILRDEHSLLTQYKMIVWGRVFTPVQARAPPQYRNYDPMCLVSLMLRSRHRAARRAGSYVCCGHKHSLRERHFLRPTLHLNLTPHLPNSISITGCSIYCSTYMLHSQARPLHMRRIMCAGRHLHGPRIPVRCGLACGY